MFYLFKILFVAECHLYRQIWKNATVNFYNVFMANHNNNYKII